MLVMFPEGTRSRTGGLSRGHPGTGLIALRTGAPVLPVAVTGTEHVRWPWIFLKPLSMRHVKVTIGEPFRLPPVERINSEAATEATTTIMRRIAALLPPQYRGVYADAEERPVEAPAAAKQA
jgi:1-acyl-sn-glycerol-3-phosphate acyltransferase